MQTARALLVVLLVNAPVLLSTHASARAQTSATPPTPHAANAPDRGSLDGNAYTNDFFGLTLTLPAGWKAQGEAVRERNREAGRKNFDTGDPAARARLEKSVGNTLNLLTAYQYPVGSAVHFNPAFLCAAERIPAAASGATDADYMAVLKQTFRYSRAPITVDRDVYTEQVGGETFAVVDITTRFPDAVGHQRYYAHIRRGYALSLVLTYLTDEQLRTLEGVVESARFR
jgi:hypothetical protein